METKKVLLQLRLGKDETIAEDEEDKKTETCRKVRIRSLPKRDMETKQEKSRQSAKECRARKNMRFQYLDNLVRETERAVLCLQTELESLSAWAADLDEGRVPKALKEYRLLHDDETCTTGKGSLQQIPGHYMPMPIKQEPLDIDTAQDKTEDIKLATSPTSSFAAMMLDKNN